jgi:hypothetical protein
LLLVEVAEAKVFFDSGVATETGICRFAMGGGLMVGGCSRACFSWSARAYTVQPFVSFF